MYVAARHMLDILLFATDYDISAQFNLIGMFVACIVPRSWARQSWPPWSATLQVSDKDQPTCHITALSDPPSRERHHCSGATVWWQVPGFQRGAFPGL